MIFCLDKNEQSFCWTGSAKAVGYLLSPKSSVNQQQKQNPGLEQPFIISAPQQTLQNAPPVQARDAEMAASLW